MGFIYVKDEIEGKLELLNDISKINNEDINKVIEQMMNEETNMTECLNDNALRFKLFSKEIAKSYKECVSKEVEYLDEIWNSCEDKRKNFYEKTRELKNQINQITYKFESLKESMGKLNFYGMEKMIEMIEKFNRMNDKDKELLLKLLEMNKESN